MDYQTDDEVVESIKGWWKNNGSALFVGVLIVLVGNFGWRYYKNHQTTVKK